MQTPHFAATRWDGAIRAHGFVVRRLFGLHQTALLTPRPAPGLHTVAHVWGLNQRFHNNKEEEPHVNKKRDTDAAQRYCAALFF